MFGAGGVLRDGEEGLRDSCGTAAPLVAVDLGGERAQGAANEPGGAVGVMAGASAGYQAGPALDVGDGLGAGPAAGDLGERGRDPRQAVQAGAALAGAFEREVADDEIGRASCRERVLVAV